MARRVAKGQRIHGRAPGAQPIVAPLPRRRTVRTERAAKDRQTENSGATPQASASQAARSVFGACLALQEIADDHERPLRLQLEHTAVVTRALRGALLHHATDPPPAALSGHAPDGPRLERPHAAFLAVPGLDTDAATGRILGAAIVLPRGIAEEDLQAVLLATARWERRGVRLMLGRLGVMRLSRASDTSESGPFASTRWVGPSHHWASVTPIALHHNPGNLASRDPAVTCRATQHAARTVAEACEHIGLPQPAEVRILRRSRFAAAPPARAFMPYPGRGSGFKRVCVHVELRFAEPVAGPVLLGAGRYFGVGLCGAHMPESEVPDSRANLFPHPEAP